MRSDYSVMDSIFGALIASGLILVFMWPIGIPVAIVLFFLIIKYDRDEHSLK
jgi:ABC-type phosphate transport system permease subunit